MRFSSSGVRRSRLAASVAFLLALSFVGLVGPGLDGQENAFERGDANTDGFLSISDSLTIRRWLFNGDPQPTCLDAADSNDDGRVNITDIIFILNALFLGGPELPAPAMEIGPDPTPGDSLSCDSYEVTAPESTDDILRVGECRGVPGELVAIPIFVTNSREIEAYQLVLAYDPSMVSFEPEPHENPRASDWVTFDGTFYESIRDDFQGFVSVTHPEDGLLLIGFIPSLIHTGSETPPGVDRLVFNVMGRVSPDAPDGEIVRIEPFNGPNGEGIGPYALRNEFTSRGDARVVSVIPTTVSGLIEIVADVTIFRGDANHDQQVNISDPIYTLSYLFLGGPRAPCRDEADANDDGVIDLTDAVVTLETLFSGEATIAAPYPEVGPDPTPDPLGFCDPAI